MNLCSLLNSIISIFSHKSRADLSMLLLYIKKWYITWRIHNSEIFLRLKLKKHFQPFPIYLNEQGREMFSILF